MPFALLSARFVKKPTVSGTIGKMQGKKNAATPANKPNPNVTQSEEGSLVTAPIGTDGAKFVESVFNDGEVALSLALATLSSFEPTVINSISSKSPAVSVVSV